MKLSAKVTYEWHGKGKFATCLYYCEYPDGKKKLCMDERTAKKMADAYNAQFAEDVAKTAGGHKA